MRDFSSLIEYLFSNFQELHVPKIGWTDVVEVILISFFIFQVLVWFKNSRAWTLLRAVVFLAVFVTIAWLLNMNTIVWIFQSLFSIAAMMIIVVMQPELRKGLDQLGQGQFFSSLMIFDIFRAGETEGRFSDRTASEITRACMEMAKVKTGALIVIENENSLSEYERTGIRLDAEVSSQLLINIFEKNTPLHDGAVIVRGDRITSATCYLPLSDSTVLSKALGTRHRAGVGMSESTDSMTIIVSEETGNVSVAYLGALSRVTDADALLEMLTRIQNKHDPSGPKQKVGILKMMGRGQK
ncbi:MAG: diadenylate cyclase CdaA [Lachnospiraceae bacterium]|nr:diadenylate cyclase CdaA [Lachnospiraceae bacterium]